MDARFEDIVASAMKLPEWDRVRLAQKFIASVDRDIAPNVKAPWLGEAERRLEELRSGKTKGIPAEGVFTRAGAALHRGEESTITTVSTNTGQVQYGQS